MSSVVLGLKHLSLDSEKESIQCKSAKRTEFTEPLDT